MRRDRLKINRAIGLREVKEDLRNLLKEQHTLAYKELSSIAVSIQGEAEALVPVKTGALRDSIEVTVSKNPRYPGVIATATARNVRTNYDYALMQEVREDYQHPNGGQAHYLEQPFRKYTDEFFRRMGW